jgi:hypothetical protein
MFSKFKGKKWVECGSKHLLEKYLINWIHRFFIEVSLNLILTNFRNGFENMKVKKHWNSFTSNQFVCYKDDGNKTLE